MDRRAGDASDPAPAGAPGFTVQVGRDKIAGMSLVSRWASSPGRTILTGLVAMLAAVSVGSAVYAIGLSMLIGAVVVTSGLAHGAAADVAVSGASAVVLAVEVVGVAIAAAVPAVLLSRSPTSSPRWWPPLSAGLVVQAAFWANAIGAASRSGDWTDLYLWPTHLSSWLCVVATQLVVVNLIRRR